jgi:hypothetical protein
MTEPLVIDVVSVDSFDHRVASEGPLVVVEPLYGCVAIAAALDAGWSSVDIAFEESGVAPIPLVSFDQPPPVEHREAGRCRVRATDVRDALDVALDDAVPHPTEFVLLGSVANARPLASTLVRQLDDAATRITLLLAPSTAADGPAGVDDRPTEAVTIDAWWAAGVIIRILLEESDERDLALTDAAGIAVTLAQGAEAPAVQLTAGTRWRAHLAKGGHADDLRAAGSVDSLGIVPRVALVDGAYVATAAAIA